MSQLERRLDEDAQELGREAVLSGNQRRELEQRARFTSARFAHDRKKVDRLTRGLAQKKDPHQKSTDCGACGLRLPHLLDFARERRCARWFEFEQTLEVGRGFCPPADVDVQARTQLQRLDVVGALAQNLVHDDQAGRRVAALLARHLQLAHGA